MADRYPIVVINGELKELPSGDTIPAAVVPSTFLGLTDTPSAYTAQALKAVRVNAGETALEFYTPSSGITIGTTPISSGGANRVLFHSASGDYVEESANFKFDGSNLILGNSTKHLEIGLDSSYNAVFGHAYSASDNIAQYQLKYFRSGSFAAAGLALIDTGYGYTTVLNTAGSGNLYWTDGSGSPGTLSVGTWTNPTDGSNFQAGWGRWIIEAGAFVVNKTTWGGNAQFEIRGTTEQIRVEYDGSNYYKTTVGSTGTVTFDAVGSGAKFVFSDAVEIGGSLTLSAQNIVTDTSTGMKIGTGTTQKLGFFNATPVTQRANIGQLTDITGGTIVTTLQDCDSGGVADVSTVNDNFAGVVSKINKLEAALKDLGFSA